MVAWYHDTMVPWYRLWGHFGITLGSIWVHFGITLRSLWGHLGNILGSLWDHFEVTLGSHWDHFRVTLGSFWHRSGTTDFHQNVAEQILAPESRARAISWGKVNRISRSIRSTGLRFQVGGWQQGAKPLGSTQASTGTLDIRLSG